MEYTTQQWKEKNIFQVIDINSLKKWLKKYASLIETENDCLVDEYKNIYIFKKRKFILTHTFGNGWHLRIEHNNDNDDNKIISLIKDFIIKM